MPGQASIIGRVRVIGQPNTSAPSASVAAQAFGSGTPSGTASPAALLHPGRAFGMRFWLGVGSIGLLWWIYRSLPE